MVTSAVRRTAILTTSAALAISGVSLAVGPAGAAARHPAAPTVKYQNSYLTGVAVAPHSSTAFAFGQHATGTGASFFALKGSGSHWKSVSLQGGTTSSLVSIAAGSPSSAWLVGSRYNNGSLPVIEHSSGGAFKVMKNKLGGGQLTSVAASSKTNAWVVGTGTSSALAARWNGHKWSKVKTPSSTGLAFSQVSTSSPKNVWILANASGVISVGHWNGHKLTIKKLPVPVGALPTNIATSSAKDTWVTGRRSVGTAGKTEPFTTHWNGKSWKSVSAPSSGFYTTPVGLSMAGSRVYLVGQSASKTALKNKPFALRFSGGHWHTVHSVSKGKQSSFNSVGVSSKEVVAVGSWSLRGICTTHPSPLEPLAETLHGSSFGTTSTPHARRSQTARAAFSPDVPSC